MFSGAIFDVDGTLLDSMQVWESMTGRFLDKFGVKMTREMAEKYRTMTLETSLPLIVSTYKLSMSKEEIFEEFTKMAIEEYTKNVPSKPGAVEYITGLAKKGIKIAIATSGFEDACRGAFARLGILDYIDAFAFSSEVGVDKSNPDIYLLAAKRLGKQPAECMVFEDILPGICGAKRAGMMTTAVADKSNRGETDSLKACADRYITEWSELFDDIAD